MNDVAVIDRFLDVFSRYIDSGFGLLGGAESLVPSDQHIDVKTQARSPRGDCLPA